MPNITLDRDKVYNIGVESKRDIKKLWLELKETYDREKHLNQPTLSIIHLDGSRQAVWDFSTSSVSSSTSSSASFDISSGGEDWIYLEP